MAGISKARMMVSGRSLETATALLTGAFGAAVVVSSLGNGIGWGAARAGARAVRLLARSPPVLVPLWRRRRHLSVHRRAHHFRRQPVQPRTGMAAGTRRRASG